MPAAILSWLLAFSLIVPLAPAADVALISRTMWGEARGCPRVEREAVAWTILNRVESDRFPDSVQAVVTAPDQFAGYSPRFPADPFREEAKTVLIRRHAGERDLPEDILYFTGDGRRNYFTNTYGGSDYYRFPGWE